MRFGTLFTFTKFKTFSKRDGSIASSRLFCLGKRKFLRVFLFSLILLCIGSKAYSDSLVINYINKKTLYKWDGKNLINYSNNKKLYKWDGSSIANYSTNKKLYKWDRTSIANYSNNKKLYKWDGTNISNYSNNKKLYKLNGNTVLVYSTNKKILKIDGLIPIPILIALVTEIL